MGNRIDEGTLLYLAYRSFMLWLSLATAYSLIGRVRVTKDHQLPIVYNTLQFVNSYRLLNKAALTCKAAR